jgi:hypothetical protein
MVPYDLVIRHAGQSLYLRVRRGDARDLFVLREDGEYMLADDLTLDEARDVISALVAHLAATRRP